MSLEDELRDLVRNSKRPQKDIAKAAKMNAVNLSQFVTGKRSLSYGSMEKLAEALGVKITTKKAGIKKS
jgi:transcriptional regulator with XRE-family HTH domain